MRKKTLMAMLVFVLAVTAAGAFASDGRCEARKSKDPFADPAGPKPKKGKRGKKSAPAPLPGACVIEK